MELSDTFTVLIVGDGSDGNRVRSLAEDWRGHGLLRDFAVVTPSGVHRDPNGPATVVGTVVGDAEPVELMRHLSSRRRRVIRVVVLHLLTHAHAYGEDLVAACESVADLVQRAMPVSNGTSEHDVRLLRVNLLVPETDVKPQIDALLQPGWEVNAVISPEDRPDLDRLNVFIRADENLHGHALAAAATVSGLWRGMNEAAFDATRLDSTSGPRDVIVVRGQAKMVLGDGRSTRLAEEVVRSVALESDGAVRHLEWGYLSDRPAELVDSIVARLLDTPDWVPAAHDRPVLEKRRTRPAPWSAGGCGSRRSCHRAWPGCSVPRPSRASSRR